MSGGGMTPARSFRTTFSQSSALSPMALKSAPSSEKLAVLRRALWQVTQYWSISAFCFATVAASGATVAVRTGRAATVGAAGREATAGAGEPGAAFVRVCPCIRTTETIERIADVTINQGVADRPNRITGFSLGRHLRRRIRESLIWPRIQSTSMTTMRPAHIAG